jgi:hypothetical protein
VGCQLDHALGQEELFTAYYKRAYPLTDKDLESRVDLASATAFRITTCAPRACKSGNLARRSPSVLSNPPVAAPLFLHHGRDRTRLGFIVASKRAECEAFDQRGISLGRFPDKDAAARAV